MEFLKKQFFEVRQANLIFKYVRLEEFLNRNIEENDPQIANDGKELINCENPEFHFLLRFFFILSEFQLVNDDERAIYFNGAPEEPIMCECRNLLDEEFLLKGYFAAIPSVKPVSHEYYLRISERCGNCNRMIWIFTNIGIAPKFFYFFCPTLDFNGGQSYSEQDLLLECCGIARLWLNACSERDFLRYREDIIMFDNILTKKFAPINKLKRISNTLK